MQEVVTVKVEKGVMTSYFMGDMRITREYDLKSMTMGEIVKSIVYDTVRDKSDPRNWVIGIDTPNKMYIAVYVDNYSKVAR